MQHHNWLRCLLGLIVGALVACLLMFVGPYWQAWQVRQHYAAQDSRPASQVGGLKAVQRQQLAAMNYQSGQGVIVYVNHGRSTLNPKSWRHNEVDFASLDTLSRTSRGNTAFLENRNHADTELRVSQNVQPTGWHHNSGGQLVYNRGHLIAYSLTAGIDPQTGRYHHGVVGDQDNPRNLFTETDFINQEVQTVYETKVRHAIEHHEHVIYQVTPIFRANELVPRGVNMQAVSTDGRLNFNVYIFNVEPGVRIDYQTGSYVMDSRMIIPVPYGAEKANDNSQGDGEFRYLGNYSRPDASHPRHYERTW